MESDNWFVILKDKHQGPYSKSELLGMYKGKEISEKTNLWSEGMAKPIIFQDLLKREKSSERVVQIMDDLEEKNEVQPLNGKIKEEDVLPPLPVEVQVAELKKKVSQPEQNNEVDIEFEPEFELGEKEVKKTSKIWLFMGSFSVLGAIALYLGFTYFLNGSFQGSRLGARPEGMSLKVYDEFKTNVREARGKSFFFKLSKDKKQVWIATNQTVEGNIDLKFKSVADQVLGEPTVFSVSGKARDGFIELSDIYFEEGSRLLDGYYQVTADNLGEVLINGKFLVSSVGEKSFNVLLKDFNSQVEINIAEFKQELVQKYSTVRMMVRQIISSLNRVQNSVGAQRFESEYKRKFGVFFTEFVLNNEKQFGQISKQSFDDKEVVLKQYNSLTALAKEIGVVAAETIEKFSQTKKRAQILKIKRNGIKRLDLIVIKSKTAFKAK